MYCELQHDALLHLSGPDALTFIQSQTTCDASAIDPEHAVVGAYCNPKGRMICDFLASQLGENHYVLRMRRSIVASSMATFSKYIVFSKAELEADNSQWKILAIWGNDAKDLLGEVFTELPAGKYLATGDADHRLIQLDDAGQHFECYINSHSNPSLAQALDDTLAAGSEEDWEVEQIYSGIARIESETVEEFIPQMLNYDVTGHVSFTKGCYPGQEVVARMHYRGKAKRRLYLVSCENDDSAEAGTALYTADNPQSVGNVANIATQSTGQRVALVVSTEPGIEAGLHIAAPDGPAVSSLDLPYSIENA